MNTLSINIAGTNRTAWFADSRLSIERRLPGRARLRGIVRDRGRGWRPELGSSISVTLDGAIIFAGHIWRMDERALVGAGVTEIELEAVDYHHIAARRTITAVYTGWYLPNILNHIVSVGLAGDGITLYGSIPNDLVGGTLAFDHEPVAGALNKLAELLGYIWWIDANKRLRFGPFSTWEAGWDVADDSEHISEMRLTRTLESYRNRQHVRVQVGQLPEVWEDTRTIPGPGRWMLSSTWAIEELYQLTVDGEAQTFRGYNPDELPEEPPSDVGWYYIIGAGGVYTAAFEPEGGETVWFQYKPGDPWNQWQAGLRVVTESDDDEIARMRELTGTSGIIEAVEDSKILMDADAMVALARARLRQYARDGISMELTTLRTDVEPGMRVSADSTLFGYSGTLVVESCEFEVESLGAAVLARARVRLTDTDAAALDSVGYFGRIIEMARGGAAVGGAAPPAGEITLYRSVLVDTESGRGALSLDRALLYGTTYGVDHTVEDDDHGREYYRTGVGQRVG